MTKEEILLPHIKYAWERGDAAHVVPFKSAKQSMDEYAKQQTIAFGIWLAKEGYYSDYEEVAEWKSLKPNCDNTWTTEELYDQFIENRQDIISQG